MAMNSVGELIAYHDPDYVLLSREDRLHLQAQVLCFVFGITSSADMGTDFKHTLSWSGQGCTDFRKKLWRSGTILKNLKLYLYARANEVPARYQDYGLGELDARFVTQIVKSETGQARKLVRVLRAQYKTHPVRTVKNFDRGLNLAVKRLMETAYIEKFVGKKFRFLTQSGQKDEGSLVAELMEFGLRSAYRAIPRIESVLHLTNIMKTGIHNRGQNIIKEETTQKRKRLVKNEDGTFSGLVLSLNNATFEQTFALEQAGSGSLNVCNGLMAGIDGRSIAYERPTDIDRQRDLVKVVDSFYAGCRLPGKRTFMTLLMGVYDDKFSEFLGQPNDDAYLRLDRKIYVEKVRSYMGVSKDSARQFIGEMRTAFQDFRN